MPKFSIDGRDIEFSRSQTIIEAAKANGIEIPHFCWHPSLSISGNCRMCLVEVEKMPKLVIACSTLAADGIIVHVNSESALAARKAVMEFILINHPLDCPICDEAGECKLQDYTYSHSIGESRFIEEKQHKQKRVQLGPRIMFDGERCISCSRCIRYSDEIANKNQLTFVQRGDRVTIRTFPGEEFNNPYTLNTVDICPVGALTSQDFRFKSRVWEMSSTKSICIGCARGCNIDVWVRNNEILRLTPRFNEEVNSYWMCDNGRLNTFKFVNADDRIDGPFIRRDGELQKAGWDEAAKVTAEKLKNFKANEIAFIGSAFATLEDNYALVRFMKSIGIKNIDIAGHVFPGDADDILIREDKTPNSYGAQLTGSVPSSDSFTFQEILSGINSGKIKVLYVLEDDIASLEKGYEKILSKLDLLVVHAVNKNITASLADIIFPASSFAEKHGTIVNFQGRVQRLRPAVATKEYDRALDNLSMSRWDKFGSEFDRWAQGRKIDAKPSWKIISLISQFTGAKFKYNMAEEVFADLAASVDALKGINYDTIGDSGILLENVNIEKPESV